MKKVLFVATVESHIIRFHLPFIEYFKKNGYEVHIACKGNTAGDFCDVLYNIEFSRSPFNIKNISAYFKLKKIINENNYELIHCHTPVGGVVGRLASIKARSKGSKVMYTAHGFQFCKGGGFFNYLLFYPPEFLCSFFTDCIITINSEDYEFAKKYLNRKLDVELVGGVGINLEKYKAPAIDNLSLKNEFEIASDDFVLVYVADISKRKNQIFLIDEVCRLKKHIPKIKVIFVGGGYFEKLKETVAKKNITDNIIFAGEREDVSEILSLANIYVSPSKREGLPRNILEAMSAGKCIVASNVRGNRDLINNGINGFVFELDDKNGFEKIITSLYDKKELIQDVSNAAYNSVVSYSLSNIVNKMDLIYKKFL